DPFTFAAFTTGSERLDVLEYDPADGGTFTANGEVPAKAVMLQMAVDDPTIPNKSTEVLAKIMDVSLENTTFSDVSHGFFNERDTDSEEYPQAYCARLQAAQWLSSGLDGSAELPAEL